MKERARARGLLRRRGRLLLLLLLALSSLSGCAGGRSYLKARGRDLGDCGRGRLALGVGRYAEAEATALLQPAVGLIDASLAPRYSIGWDPRPGRPKGLLRTAAFPTLLFAWPYYGAAETREGYGDTHPYLRGALGPWILMGNHHVEGRSNALLLLDRLIPNPRLAPPLGRQEAPDPSIADHAWLAVSGTVLFLNIDAGVNPLEILDLVAGLVGLDLLGDDGRSPEGL
ncbi:MAG: hypothetical protein ACE5GW_03080 [Planctomycetota bacterium]